MNRKTAVSILAGSVAFLSIGAVPMYAFSQEAQTYRFEAEEANLTYCKEQADPYEEPRFYLTEEGEELVHKVFGEEADVEGFLGILGYSTEAMDAWTENLIGTSDSASGGSYLRQIDSPRNVVRFELNADRDAQARLTFRAASSALEYASHTTADITDLDKKMAITVNGQLLDLSGLTISGSDSLTETAWQDLTFDTQLAEGQNLIEIYVYSREYQNKRDTITEQGIESKVTIDEISDKVPNFDYLEVETDAVVSWSENESDAEIGQGVPVLENLKISWPENYHAYDCESQYVLRYAATAVFDDGSQLDVTDQALFEGDLTTPGEQEMKFTYARNGIAKEAVSTLEVVDTPFAAAEIPAEYRETEAEEKGSIEHLEYKTFVYDAEGTAGEEAFNEAYVYLPYDYTPEKQYNILYLLHGGGDSAGYWFAQGEYAAGGERDSTATNITVKVLDNLIQKGYCEPLIVVTPSLMTGSESGVNGTTTFRYELKNDLIPFVEAQYSTYAGGDVSPEGLINSRAHRAYDGLSMGSITSFQSILTGCTDYIGNIGSFSGAIPPSFTGDTSAATIEDIADALNTDFAKYPIYYWYNGNGTADMAHDEHCQAYKRMLELCPDKLTEGVNTLFNDKPGHSHSYESWVIDLYNTLGVFFQGE